MYGFNLNTAMDNLRRQSYSESLKTTLNCYQLSSADSLSGPSGYSALAAQLWFKENKQSPPIPPPPLIQIPLLMPNDTSTQRAETLLGGERISCFVVGGEKRLCLPQILTTVLRDFSISEINRTCAELHIYCSRCFPDQLEILKVLGILPFNTTQCGLITKTDAERLVAALGVEYHLNAKHDLSNGDAKGIQVYHECFGRGDGMFYPDLYVAPDATCIACMDCRITFSPARFVAHSHRGLEKRTCHWGFDPENWRSYLLLPKETEKAKRKELEKVLNALKAKFDLRNADSYNGGSPSTLKRRLDSDYGNEQNKRMKEEKSEEPVYLSPHRAPPMCFGFPFGIRSSAFKPWSPGLPMGLPHIPDLQAAQEEALMKALGPMMQDRRLLPGYLQFGPPAVVPPQDSNGLTTALRKAQAAPNITLAPAEQQKRTANIIMEQERRRDAALRSQAELIEKNRNGASPPRKFVKITSPKRTEDKELLSRISQNHRRSPCRRSSEETHHRTTNITPKRESKAARSPTDPPVHKSYPCNGGVKDRRHNLSDQHSNDKENESETRVTDGTDARKSSPGVVKHIPPLIAMSNAVAAASAMLELSSSVKPKRRSLPETSAISPSHRPASSPPPLELVKGSLPTHKSSSDISNDVPHATAYPQVVPLDGSHKHFKWLFASNSYIISAAGTQELKLFHMLIESGVNVDSVKQQLMHEVVKMKSRYEEKLDIQARVKRDIEAELECVKASKKQCLENAATARRQICIEMERMRNDHSTRIKEANDSLIELGKQIKGINNMASSHDERILLQHKLMEKLHKQIDDREEAADHLQKELFEEKDRRFEAEKKLEQMTAGSRGRIPFLMDGPLSSMIRGSRNSHESSMGSKQRPLLSASGRKNLETMTSSACSANPQTGLCDDDVIDVTTIPNKLSSKDSGIHDISPL